MEKYIDKLQQFVAENSPLVTHFALKVVLSCVAFFVGIRVVKALIGIFRRSLTRAGVDLGVVHFTASLSKFLLYMLLVFTIAMQFGVKESSVAALLGTAGVTIGLALQGGLANLAGGVMLMLFHPFQVGDYIIQNAQNGCEGTVDKIEICYTTLLSVDNKRVVIPNGTLSNSTIINVTANAQRKLEIKVGISYESDMHLAKEILERLLREDPDTRSNKDMVVFVDELAESTVIMGFRVWVPTDRYFPVKWRLNEQIKEEFDKNKIVIAYNQLDVHVHEKKDS